MSYIQILIFSFPTKLGLDSLKQKFTVTWPYWIDFGSGSGAYDKVLLENGNLKHISLVDASKTMLERAQELLGEANLADRVDIINERFDQISRSE